MDSFDELEQLVAEYEKKVEQTHAQMEKFLKRLRIEKLLHEHDLPINNMDSIYTRIDGIDTDIYFSVFFTGCSIPLLKLRLQDTPIELWPESWRWYYPSIPPIEVRMETANKFNNNK